jgi:hypothetical protein
MLTAEQNQRLLEEIDANRRFLLLACESNPALAARYQQCAGLPRGDWRECIASPDSPAGEDVTRRDRRPTGTDT